MTSTACSRPHAPGLAGWHEHHADVHDGCERFFRTMYNAHLVGEWLPALGGVVEKLERGATVADVGCGHGASTVTMAQAFPSSTFIGFDYHPASISDLITTFDALRDRGDPVGAAAGTCTPPRLTMAPGWS